MQHGQTLETFWSTEDARHRGHVLCNHICMKCPDQANLYTQKADSRLPGAGGGGGEWTVTADGSEFLEKGDERVWNYMEVGNCSLQNGSF